MASHNPQTEELYTICDSSPDPAGTGLVGSHSQINLNRSALGHPKIRYRDLVLEADVYLAPGIPMPAGQIALEVHVYCPRCRHNLRITSDRKKIEFDPAAGAPQDGGRISIEAFQCTWEQEDHNGSGLCKTKLAVENNIARDA